MTVSGRQIRAARALLDLTREDLSKKCGITMITIRNIETEVVEPQGKTLANILAIFDKEGIEFLEDDGVRMCKQKLKTYGGKTGYLQLLNHIYDVVKNGGRIRQFNFGDERYLPLSDDFGASHLERMESIAGLDAKVLVPEGEKGKQVSYCSYRTLDAVYNDVAPWYVYGDFLILPLHDTGNRREFISIQSKQVVERYVREFDVFWNLSVQSMKKRRK